MPKNPAYDHNWAKVRSAVLDRDGHRCQLKLPGCTTVANHVDHIMPLSEGGARLDPFNLRASCQHCNLSRNATRGRELANALLGELGSSPSRPW